MAKRGRPRKDPFAILAVEWKDAVAASSPEEINARIAEIAKAEEANLRMLKEDEHVKEVAAELKEAKAGYVEATKQHKAMLEFAIRVLGDKGKSNEGEGVDP